MQTVILPDARQKIKALAPLTSFECDGEPALKPLSARKQEALLNSVVQVQRPDGPMTVLRTGQTSACERNCRYCPFRAGRDQTPRVTFAPDELAREFEKMARAGVVKGLFLSSGIIGGGAKTMDPMLATVDILRRKYEYRGYIHLKIMPGSEPAQIERAFRLADRVSVNLEGANTDRLAFLAPQKDMRAELLPAMEQVNRLAVELPEIVKRPSMVTQFVVGPAGETDQEILTGVDWLYRKMHLARAYYSKFNPIPNTPLEDYTPTTPARQHRLYQADWLLRFYGFSLTDLPFDPAGALPAEIDPKLAWAREHLISQPVEVNRASRADLLRVPGIGPQSAEAILEGRKTGVLSDLTHLSKLGAIANRAAPFILLNGKRPPRQLDLL